ncbi:hypothetical protein QYM36_007520 [Artemia franciscana]|uniref:HMG box domain-containing protein n=2 Tax=Artemia franciscana TaxID=6661 RepID=A0AA88IEM0_ARTSF|nr:hypothetical protein QYM36_007520 [Artemia franciscana]
MASSRNEVDVDDILAMVNEDEIETESVVSVKREASKTSLPEKSIQVPFQPGSTPVHLNDRYMIYNYIGYVRSQEFEDSIIDIAFHDVTVHHNIHMSNTYGHTMADLSEQCCILGAEKSGETPGKVVVLQLNSWDQHQEWSVDFVDEEPVCVGTGENFAAVAMDTNLIRLFTVTGVQRGLLTAPGRVVCASARGNKLFIVFHMALGVKDDSALGFCIAEIPFNFVPPFWCEPPQPLPLKPGSVLQWIGFSDDSNPVIMDSTGVVNILYRNSWIPIFETRRKLSNKSDNYFIVGISEREQNIRAILCKGSRYPAAHITPVVQLIGWQMPLCDMDTDKGVQEEALLRWSLVEQLVPQDCREATEAVKKIREGLMKLFALSTAADRDTRAYSVASLMNTAHQVQLAAKYALRTQHRKLADKLHQLANQKLDEEAQAELETLTTEQDSSIAEEVTPVRRSIAENPLLKAKSIEETPSTVPSLMTPLSLGKKNPFAKKQEKTVEPSMNVLDTLTVKQNKPKEFGTLPTDIQTSKKTLKPKQMTLKDRFLDKSKTNGIETATIEQTINVETENSENKVVTEAIQNGEGNVEQPKLSGFALFLHENRASLLEELPDSLEEEITKVAVQRFRKLPSEEKAKYLNTSKKRKPLESDDCSDQKRTKGFSGLKSFAREDED